MFQSEHEKDQHRLELPSFGVLLDSINDLRTKMLCNGPCAEARPLYEFYSVPGPDERLIKGDACITCLTRKGIEVNVEEGKDPHWLRIEYSDRLETWRSSLVLMKGLAIDDGEMQGLKKRSMWTHPIRPLVLADHDTVKKFIEGAHRSGLTKDLALKMNIAEQCMAAVKEQVAQQGEAISDLQEQLRFLAQGREASGLKTAKPTRKRVTRSMSRRQIET